MTVVAASPLPNRRVVRTLIEDLIGRDLELKDAGPIPVKPTNVVSVYVTDKLVLSAVAVVDLEGAARLGGALGLLPKGGVNDAITAKTLSSVIRENCYEVMNVLSASFNVEGAPHVRLYEMYGPGGTLPPDVAAISRVIGSRLDVELSIAGYGACHLSIITC
jgi:hypothetical protein